MTNLLLKRVFCCIAYNFANLSATDFEDLSRDLVGRALGVQFEAFCPGADGGIDGRFAVGSTTIILQAKHYERSTFAGLKRVMVKERASIAQLAPQRYVLTTSQGLTPANKSALREVIGPALQSESDIYGADDLAALLRRYPDIEKAHSKLWLVSGSVLQEIIATAVNDGNERSRELPKPLADLLAPASNSPVDFAADDAVPQRDVLFIAKTPQDDDFTLWLAPKLEAEGYAVFADILTLEPGERWRKERTQALRNRAIKVLVLCRDSSLAASEVQDDISVASELAEELKDKRFIIPLRLEPFKKVHGLGDAVYVDFVRGWGEGLQALVDLLKRQRVKKRGAGPAIHPNWEIYRRRGTIPLQSKSERLTSNWLRVSEVPDQIFYYEPIGSIDRRMLARTLANMPRTVTLYAAGFFSFANADEINDTLNRLGRFRVKHAIPLIKFVEEGFPELGAERQSASNFVYALFRNAWNAYCYKIGLVERQYSNAVGFHVSPEQAAIGQHIYWGGQGERRWSMLRNVSRWYVWSFGVTAVPAFSPFYHFRLKSRVLFASPEQMAREVVIEDARKQHRLRRSICKGWRNKQWHGRLRAFLEILSKESAYVRLPLSDSNFVVLDASPMLFISPVSTMLPDALNDDEEETDASTLGRPEPDDIDQ